MVKLDFHPANRPFLQIPGSGSVPDRILRAISYPTIDHRCVGGLLVDRFGNWDLPLVGSMTLIEVAVVLAFVH
ncbi:MAG: hypothetical protein EPN46_02235 [Candidimonas sp.]|nr:MAG: hypothetical protein EPN46_02235 [Candidimonas sp.]